MTTLLIIITILFLLFATGGFILFHQSRKIFREQKNLERGLKTVALYIHLPPPSDDLEVNGRDVRDVTQETISRAEIVYNILTSTFQKNFKANYYGQKHFSFEIIGSNGYVYFYASVPVSLVEVVKQAIISAYPTARLEETIDHNIFNEAGKSTGVTGGELELKEKFAFPIATYQEIKRDSMVSILNALSLLTKEDGAAIQFLIRPANPSWTKISHEISSNKRKGKDKKSSFLNNLKVIAVSLSKPPSEQKSDEKSHELSSLDQSVVDSIDDKTRYPGYEVSIRIVVSSNIIQRSQDILKNIVATFSLYNSPSKNGFKFIPANDVEELISNYILRIFPQSKNKTILNSVELATLFHFPDQRSIPTSQVTRQASRQVDGPPNVPDNGLLLGFNEFRGVRKPIRLALADRQRHLYAVGQTGVGKSTFLENLALQDMINGDGFAFVDPHGDTVEKLLAMTPAERAEDVIYFSPSDMDNPMGLNLFEFDNPDQKDFLIQEALNMLYKLYDPNHSGIMGPRYENLFRMAALTIMADPAGGTFVDIPKLFRDPAFVEQKLKFVTDNNVIDFWRKEMPASQRSNDFGEVVAWFVSKFGAFLSNDMMRNIIGQTKSSFDMRDIMDNKKILLVNLSKGRLGDLNSKLLGMIFVMKFQAAAMSRTDIPEKERQDFCLFVDEFQNFSTDSFATIMSEARKFHLNLIVANQFTTQLSEEIRDAVFGNVGTIVSFRVGQNDVEILGRYFQPTFSNDDLLRIPNYNSIVRTLIDGVPTQSFSMVGLPTLGTPNQRLFEALKQLSAIKYGRVRAQVEKEISERMAVKANPLVNNNLGARPSATPASIRKDNNSFLDDWLAKRKKVDSPVQTVNPVPNPISNTNQTPAANYLNANELPDTSQLVYPDQKLADEPPVSEHEFKIDRVSSQSSVINQTQNISSNEFQNKEAEDIASELRKTTSPPPKNNQPNDIVIDTDGNIIG